MKGACQEHFPKACAPCRDAHQACDKGRPCGRCRYLDRAHLCRDPLPSTRKRGRPSKHSKPSASSFTLISPNPFTRPSSAPLHASPFSSSASFLYSAAASILPSASASPASTSVPPQPEEQRPQQRNLSSSSSFASSSASSTSASASACSSSSPCPVVGEEDKNEVSLAQYCHGCGTEFMLREAAFCMACGLKRALYIPQKGMPSSPVGQGSLPKKRRREATTDSSLRPQKNHNNVTNSVHNGSKPEGSPLSSSQTNRSASSSSSSSSTSPCSSSPLDSSDCSDVDQLDPPFYTFSSPCYSCSSTASLGNIIQHNKNGRIKLWLPPMAANNVLDCCVDNECTEPWALVRPVAVRNNENSIVAVNPAFLKVSGYSQHELLGESFRIIVPEELFEIMHNIFQTTMSRLGPLRNCQVTTRDISGMATKDGTCLMTHSVTKFHFGVDGELICVVIQLTSAIPVHKSAIEWKAQASIASMRVGPRSAVVLPKDVRFHDGSFFATAPITSLAPTEEELPADDNNIFLASRSSSSPTSATTFSITPYSSSIQPYSSSSSSSSPGPALHGDASPVLFSTTDPSPPSTTYIDLLLSPAFDGGSSASLWPETPHVPPSPLSSSFASSVPMERFPPQDCTSFCQLSPSFNSYHPPSSNFYTAPFY